MKQKDRLRVLSEGYRFYALLYRVLAALLAFFALALSALPADAAVSTYWPGLAFALSLYLWSATGLGDRAAKAMGRGEVGSVGALICFMVMVVAFLAMAVTAGSVACHVYTGANSSLNLVCSAVVLTFGAGSYLIEILYLALEAPAVIASGSPTSAGAVRPG